MKIVLAFLLFITASFAHAAGMQLPNGEQQFFDANGDPLAGGFVFTYVPSTTTNKNTWQDPNLTTLNTNPIVLDSAGRARIWAAGGAQFRQVVQDSLGNLIWDQPAYVPNIGTGTVTGPATTTVNEVASWNNTTGTLLRQGPANITDSKLAAITASGSAFAGLSNPGADGPALADEICDSCGFTSYDAVRGATVVPAGTTTTIASGVAGYVQNRAATAGACALFGVGTCEVASCRTVGVNTLLMDAATFNIGADTTRAVIGYDNAINVVNPASTIVGVNLSGNSLVQPSNAIGYKVSPIGTGFEWTYGFASANGAANIAIGVGAMEATGTSIASQIIDMSYIDAGSVTQVVRQQVFASATPTWTISNSAGTGVDFSLLGASSVTLDGHSALFADGSDNLLIAGGTGLTTITIGNTTAPIALAGTAYATCTSLSTVAGVITCVP